MPSASVSVAKTALTRPRTNSSSTTSLEGRRARLDDLADPDAGRLVVEPQPRVEALLDGGLAAGAAEDERDRRQQPLRVEPIDDLGPARRPDPRPLAALPLPVGLADHLAAPPVARVVRARVLHLGQADEVGVDLPPGDAAAAVVRLLLEEVVDPAPGQDVLPQRYGAALGDDHLRVAAHRVEPVAELLGVGDGRGERDERHRLGKVDDHLFPHGAAEAVGEVVHLVHDHVPQAPQGLGARVEHVAEDLGGHDDHGRVGVDAVVAGEQADLVGPVALDEVGVLLVGQRLDRRGVEALAALCEGEVDGELADDGLARARRRGDEHALARLQGPACLDLERVQFEVVERAEGVERGGLLGGPAPGRRVRFRWCEVVCHLVIEPTRRR